ncbi:RNA recognition motif domain-containing protein [Pleionea litopenaei]|uniref:RNA recognition motif domain-containing protein n=1 Tax=Pleionea litopenaei TaxID=3070815 RepID=UPI00339017E2
MSLACKLCIRSLSLPTYPNRPLSKLSSWVGPLKGCAKVKIRVENLSDRVTGEILKDAFSDFGEVTHVEVQEEQNNKIGILKMRYNQDAKAAINIINGSPLEGNLVKVFPIYEKRRPKRSRSKR